MFLSILNLAASTNFEGYNFALQKTWSKCRKNQFNVPSKGSLSEFRDRVSYEFFQDIFVQDLNRLNHYRKKPYGFYIYAVDGDQLDLPASKEILNQGYRGWPCRKKQETHYLKMYTTQAVDVVNGLVKGIMWSNQQSEILHARDLIQKFEKNSITLYDRLHCSYDTAAIHIEAGNYFIMRIKTTGRALRTQFQDFIKSSARSEKVLLRPWIKKHRPELPVRLIKIKNPKTKEDLVIMTNLSQDQFSNRQIGELYLRRWEVEGSFRGLTSILKMEQWHSKKLNGILQEIFAILWLNNIARIECLLALKKSTGKWLNRKYQKTNFKLCISLIMDNLHLLIGKKRSQFRKILNYWLHRCVENREHLSRQYPRALKKRGRDYAWANLVPRRG